MRGFLLRFCRLQWSLRTLLAVTTLIASGSAAVTRWPYQAEAPARELLWREPATHPWTDKEGNVWSTRERAEYRGLIDRFRTRHGKSELLLDNRPRVVRHYRNGVLHGEYREYYTGGQLRTKGEYRFGLKQSVWLNYRHPLEAARNDYLLTQRFENGVPQGLWQWENAYGDIALRAEYDEGRVATVNGETVIDWQQRVGELLRPHPTNAAWQRRLRDLGDISSNDYRPTSAQWYLDPYFEFEAPFPGVPDEIYYPRVERVPREIHFAHVLHITQLAFTVRFNQVFLTTPERVGPEFDPTGITQLQVPSDSLLEQALNAEVDIDRELSNLNFRQALQYLHYECRVPLDDSALHNTLEPRDEDRSWVRLAGARSKFQVRDLLGLALFRARCRGDIVQGQLIITRQPQPKS